MRLREDIYWKIDACFLHYYSNFTEQLKLIQNEPVFLALYFLVLFSNLYSEGLLKFCVAVALTPFNVSSS